MQHNAERKLAVIADDLTGASDTACQFALYGLKPVVTHAASGQLAEAEFLVITSESRREAPAAAQEKVRELAAALLRQGYTPFYKKIDSTLKGPWCAELAGMVKTVRPDIVIVAPAFPAWGRTTVDGIQCLQGRPVSELRHPLFAQECLLLPEPADLVQALRAYFRGRVHSFKRGSLKRGPTYVARDMAAARFRGCPFLVFDASQEDDLKVVALAGCRLEEKVLWVGSGGLARYLPLGWGLRRAERSAKPLTVRRALVINGSLNPANSVQLTVLVQERGFGLLWIEDEDSDNSVQTQQKADDFLKQFENCPNAIVSVRLHKPIRSAAHLQRLQDALQYAATRCIQAWGPLGLTVIGGDTAMKLYRRLAAVGIRIEAEVQPGVPYGTWIGGRLDGEPIVTKAGGFGQADTLVRAVEFLKSAEC